MVKWAGALSDKLPDRTPEPSRQTDPGGEHVIDVRDLRMRYGKTDVLNGVSFTVRRGEVVTLLGPNGAGKTTTIEILEGFGSGRRGGRRHQCRPGAWRGSLAGADRRGAAVVARPQ